jgi:cell division protein FtsB
MGILLVSYFVYHTLQGDRGWFAMIRLQNEVNAAQSTLVHLKKERVDLQRRTQLLHGNSLDPDLLEEKSRELLNYSHPNEIVILLPKEKNGDSTKTIP